MKTTYPRTVTQRIIELQAVGFSAEETRTTLKEQNGISITLNTVYRHRKSAVGQEIVEELIRRQERSILKADTDNPALAMKYRNELLKVLVPQRVEAMSLSKYEEKLIIELWNPSAESPNPVQSARRPEAVPPSTVQN